MVAHALIPALRSQKQVDLRVQGQSGPQRELQDNRGCTETSCLGEKKTMLVCISVCMLYHTVL